jgi:hypothetical protein
MDYVNDDNFGLIGKDKGRIRTGRAAICHQSLLISGRSLLEHDMFSGARHGAYAFPNVRNDADVLMAQTGELITSCLPLQRTGKERRRLRARLDGGVVHFQALAIDPRLCQGMLGLRHLLPPAAHRLLLSCSHLR